MRKTAILSDIHGNLSALEACLAVCEREGVEDLWSLGDVIGYGPDPIAVTEIVRERFIHSLMGNHEEALVTGKHRFNPYAAQAIDWTRQQLGGKLSRIFSGRTADHLTWYGDRKPFELEHKALMVHGSIYDPVHDYVDEPENPVEAEQMIETLERDFSGFDLCFAGHNHTPFLCTKIGTLFPHDQHNRFVLPPGHKAYLCVGSVGQPRDYDPRASFAIYDGEAVTFHRLEYDLRRTQERILAAGLDPFLAERLEKGI